MVDSIFLPANRYRVALRYYRRLVELDRILIFLTPEGEDYVRNEFYLQAYEHDKKLLEKAKEEV